MPDMRLPIGYALGHPDRIATPFGAIDWSKTSRLDFALPDRETFRCLDLAYAAGRAGGTAPAFMSACNEVVVEAFLSGDVPWLAIADTIETVMDSHSPTTPRDVDDILEADRAGREAARRHLGRPMAAEPLLGRIVQGVEA